MTRAHDPLALFARELSSLENERAKTWDPASVDSMVGWMESELGMVITRVPKLHAIVRAVVTALQNRERVRIVIVGPRGGGKTMLAAGLQLLSVRFYGASWTSLGGSLEQANRLFWHVRAATQNSADLRAFVTEALATRISARNGATITVHAASEKSIRGQHPRGPSGAGGIVIDEASLVDDRLIDSALPQIASANPSLVIMLSTLGERQSGRFWELTQNPNERGYRLFDFGVFDTVERCPYECLTTCPVPAFSTDQFRDQANGKRELIHRALCAGAAHETDGWIAIDEVAQQYRDLDRHAFQREFLGTAATRIGAVFDPRDVAAAVTKRTVLNKSKDFADHERRLRKMETCLGVDWGFGSETWAVYGVRVQSHIVVFRFDWWTGTRYSVICEQIAETVKDLNVAHVMADSSNPADIDQLRELLVKSSVDADVESVPFSKWKDIGVGEVRRRFEQRQIILPRVFGNKDVHNVDKALSQIRGLTYDQNGRIVKRNDHAPDALMCMLLKWAPQYSPEPTIYSEPTVTIR